MSYTCLFFILLYLSSVTIFNQSYKCVTKDMKKPGAKTVLIEFIAGIFSVLFISFFKFTIPKSLSVYLFLGLSIVFYTIQDRLGTTARSGVDASTYSIIKQLSNVFVIALGILILHEKFILYHFLGAFLIIFSNVLILYEKDKTNWNRYYFLGILANLCLGIALFLDINISKQFNIAFYVFLITLIPSVLLLCVEKIKIIDLKVEYQLTNKGALLFTTISWPIMMISKLLAYKDESIVIVAALCSLSVMINVIVGYFIFKEKGSVLKKIIAALLIIIGIILIKI